MTPPRNLTLILCGQVYHSGRLYILLKYAKMWGRRSGLPLSLLLRILGERTSHRCSFPFSFPYCQYIISRLCFGLCSFCFCIFLCLLLLLLKHYFLLHYKFPIHYLRLSHLLAAPPRSLLASVAGLDVFILNIGQFCLCLSSISLVCHFSQ